MAQQIHQGNIQMGETKTEARLQQAQVELRAVLTIRQEAIAVLAGLLPP